MAAYASVAACATRYEIAYGALRRGLRKLTPMRRDIRYEYIRTMQIANLFPLFELFVNVFSVYRTDYTVVSKLCLSNLPLNFYGIKLIYLIVVGIFYNLPEFHKNISEKNIKIMQ